MTVSRFMFLLTTATVMGGGLPYVSAQTITDCKSLVAQGDYEDSLDATTRAVNRRSYGEDWPLLKAESEYQLGRYLEARETLLAGIQRYAWSIRLRMKLYRLTRMAGEREQSQRTAG